VLRRERNFGASTLRENMYAHVIANKSTRKESSVPIVDDAPQM
jgi:hypothetical protein